MKQQNQSFLPPVKSENNISLKSLKSFHSLDGFFEEKHEKESKERSFFDAEFTELYPDIVETFSVTPVFRPGTLLNPKEQDNFFYLKGAPIAKPTSPLRPGRQWISHTNDPSYRPGPKQRSLYESPRSRKKQSSGQLNSMLQNIKIPAPPRSQQEAKKSLRATSVKLAAHPPHHSPRSNPAPNLEIRLDQLRADREQRRHHIDQVAQAIKKNAANSSLVRQNQEQSALGLWSGEVSQLLERERRKRQNLKRKGTKARHDYSAKEENETRNEASDAIEGRVRETLIVVKQKRELCDLLTWVYLVKQVQLLWSEYHLQKSRHALVGVIIKMQRRWRAFLERRAKIKMSHALYCIGLFVTKFCRQWLHNRRVQAVQVLTTFLTEAFVGGKMLSLNNLKKKAITCQRAWRSYAQVTEARLELLGLWYVRTAKKRKRHFRKKLLAEASIRQDKEIEQHLETMRELRLLRRQKIFKNWVDRNSACPPVLGKNSSDIKIGADNTQRWDIFLDRGAGHQESLSTLDISYEFSASRPPVLDQSQMKTKKKFRVKGTTDEKNLQELDLTTWRNSDLRSPRVNRIQKSFDAKNKAATVKEQIPRRPVAIQLPLAEERSKRKTLAHFIQMKLEKALQELEERHTHPKIQRELLKTILHKKRLEYCRTIASRVDRKRMHLSNHPTNLSVFQARELLFAVEEITHDTEKQCEESQSEDIKKKGRYHFLFNKQKSFAPPPKPLFLLSCISESEMLDLVKKGESLTKRFIKKGSQIEDLERDVGVIKSMVGFGGFDSTLSIFST